MSYVANIELLLYLHSFTNIDIMCQGNAAIMVDLIDDYTGQYVLSLKLRDLEYLKWLI